jgi:hypothetical protein
MNYRGMCSFICANSSVIKQRYADASLSSIEDGTTPYMVFWRDGLKEVKLVSRRHHQPLFPLPCLPSDQSADTPPHPPVNGLRLSWVPPSGCRLYSQFALLPDSIRVLCRGSFAVVKPLHVAKLVSRAARERVLYESGFFTF